MFQRNFTIAVKEKDADYLLKVLKDNNFIRDENYFINDSYNFYIEDTIIKELNDIFSGKYQEAKKNWEENEEENKKEYEDFLEYLYATVFENVINDDDGYLSMRIEDRVFSTLMEVYDNEIEELAKGDLVK